MGFFSLWLFLSKIHPESSTRASKTPFCLQWYKTEAPWFPVHFLKAADLSPLFVWTNFLLLLYSEHSRWSTVTSVRQQRLCSRPTRQQINRPVRSCWNCSGTLQNCRATNVGHLPRSLVFFCCCCFFPPFYWGHLLLLHIDIDFIARQQWRGRWG